MKRGNVLGAMLVSYMVAFAVAAQEEPARKELRRADLAGAPGMEVVLSVTQIKPGEQITAHIHHGMETGYVLEGGMVQYAGNAPVELVTGSPIWNLRDVPHGGFKVVGTRTLKLVTVHIVDKGKPLYDWTAK
jgi:quercetin dioxygenase-like cupin family protein